MGSPFGKLQALPSNAKPITSWADRDEAFLNIAQGIRRAAEESVTSAVAAHAAAETASLYIPRPPVVGYVSRRDEQGRDIIELLREELRPEKGQVVALWGPGGSGKTVIAAETARGLLSAYAQRIVWVSTIGRSDFTLSTLLDELSTQLGRPDLRTLAPLPKAEQVRALAAHPPTLVVLDNFETIPEEEQTRCLDFLAQRAACPTLITTRSFVNRGDVYSVPLAAMTMEEARAFLQRLAERTRRPSNFDKLDSDDLIRRCEANPLVLQWVVRQIDLAKRPEDVLNDLSEGAGDAVEGVFTRSFNLPQLGDDGRDTLLALSLFTPNASRESLSVVAGFSDNLRRLNKAVENLSALWLVETTDGNERLFLRGLTRELAKSRLSNDARADEFRRRYIEHFVHHAQAHTRPTPEDFDALEAEKNNILGAMEIAFEVRDLTSMMEIRSALNEFLALRGYWDEAVRSGEQAVAAAREVKNEEQVAYFTACVANILRDRGEYEAAGRLYRESLEISKRLGSDRNVAFSLHQLGVISQEQGDLEDARRLYEESLVISKKLNNQRTIAATLRQLGTVAQQQGSLEEARRLYEESLEINKRLGDQIGVSRTLNELAMVVQDEGRLDVARRFFSESLEISKRLGDQQGIAITLHQLGIIAESEGDKTEAMPLIREALNIFEKLGSPYAEEARRNLSRIESIS
jgi:tetratricopeptide (TPR) repeat protein